MSASPTDEHPLIPATVQDRSSRARRGYILRRGIFRIIHREESVEDPPSPPGGEDKGMAGANREEKWNGDAILRRADSDQAKGREEEAVEPLNSSYWNPDEQSIPCQLAKGCQERPRRAWTKGAI